MTTGRPPVRSRPGLWPGIVGIAFVVLFVVGGGGLSGNTPDLDASDEEWLAWFDDGAHTITAVVGTFLLALAAVSFIVVVAYLASWLRRREPGNDVATSIVSIAGGAFAVAMLVAAVGMNQVAFGYVVGDVVGDDYQLMTADVARQVEVIGFGVLLIGAFFASLMVAAATWAATRAGLLPRWLTVAGWVAAVLLIFSLFIIPLFALPLWVLAISIIWLRERAPG